MKFTKSFSVALTLSITIGSLAFIPASAATTKAGAKCSSIGITSTVGAKTFICVKTSGKTVWDKGAATPTFDNLDTKRVRRIAFAEINKAVASSPKISSNITFISGKTVSPSELKVEKSALLRAERFWADTYKPAKAIAAHFTERDVDWVDAAYCSQANYCPTGGNSVISAMIKNDLNNCTSAFATRTKDGVPFFAQCLGSGSANQKNRQTGPHEYFHWVQGEYSDFGTLPNWFLEGSADYFGDALGSWTGKGVPSTMDEMQYESSYNWRNQDLCPLGELKIDDVVKCFKFTYQRPAPPAAGSRWMMAHVSYYMGSQATEAMIAVKGIGTFKAFLKDLKGNDFDTVFAKHYGLTVDEFYPKVAKYVLAMMKEYR